MKSIILTQTTKFLTPAFVILSLFITYRGHNLPGGGFIGGLMLSTAFALLAVSDGVEKARHALRVSPEFLIAAGLCIALISGLPALLGDDAFMKSLWLPEFSLPLLGKIHLGTPIVFDIGVFMTVAGFTLKVFFSLCKEEEN